MFGHFPLSVGVANLRDFAARLQHWPAYMTTGERGGGFAEVAGSLLAARSAERREDVARDATLMSSANQLPAARRE